jgi:uncharacterized protein YraI
MKSASALLALALGWLPALAGAQQVAYTAAEAHLRAGPEAGYPVLAILPPATQVVVQGCLADYRWCDVSYGPVRGWLAAAAIRYPDLNGYAAPPFVGTVAVIPVFGFVQYDYWRDHYHDRPWYRERGNWARPRHRDQPAHERPAGPSPAPLPPGAAGNSGWDRNNMNAPRPDRP